MRKVNNKVRSALLQTVKPYSKNSHHRHDRMSGEEETPEALQEARPAEEEKLELHTSLSTAERRTALQQEVEELKKKLWYEENVRRILERALSRPPGVSPHLPPYVSSNTLILVEEVANLEEEVFRLEEQVLRGRQELYQEANLSLSSKKPMERYSNDAPQPPGFSQDSVSKRVSLAKLLSDSDEYGSSVDPSGDDEDPQKKNSDTSKRSNQGKPPKIKSPGYKEKHMNVQVEFREAKKEISEESGSSTNDSVMDDQCRGPNEISENILKCLVSIFTRMKSSEKIGTDLDLLPSSSSSFKTSDGKETEDPYGICLGRPERDIGRYKHFLSVDEKSINPSFEANSSSLLHRLKILLRRLAFSDLRGLTYQQKLAFWINIYNSCMMKAFLEIVGSGCSQMVGELMQKATINVGGRVLNAMTIEHFILRFSQPPSDNAHVENLEDDEMSIRSTKGLDRPEPLVTFALSCGSWSSPAVRVYTSSRVEEELEAAKREYLEAAVGIGPANKLVIPKLLEWYSLDFASDVGSLAEWTCSQLPDRLRGDASKCIEKAKMEMMGPAQALEVSPFDFSFRYILANR